MSNRVGEVFGHPVLNPNGGDPYWIVSFRDAGAGEGTQGDCLIGIVFDGSIPKPVAVVRYEDFPGRSGFNPTLEDSDEYGPGLREAIARWLAATPTERVSWGSIKGGYR